MSNLGVYPFVVSTPATSLQQFRILLNDTAPTATADPLVGDYKFISDDSAAGLMSLYDDSPRLGAARMIETIAMSEALMRKWVTDDQSLDGPATANALRLLAAQLRAEAIGEARLEDYFDIVPLTYGADWPAEAAARQSGWLW